MSYQTTSHATLAAQLSRALRAVTDPDGVLDTDVLLKLLGWPDERGSRVMLGRLMAHGHTGKWRKIRRVGACGSRFPAWTRCVAGVEKPRKRKAPTENGNRIAEALAETRERIRLMKINNLRLIELARSGHVNPLVRARG